MNQDTICAIATAQGGAIGCIRVSGPDAIEITSRIFTPARKGKKLKDAKPYTLTFGHIHEEENIIDEVLVSLFRAPTRIQARIAQKSCATVRAIFFRRCCNCSSAMVAAWPLPVSTRNEPSWVAKWT